MKKFFVLSVSLMFVACLTIEGFAQQEEGQKKINLNAQNLAKATEIIKQNKELFKNPELLKRYLAIIRALNKANQ